MSENLQESVDNSSTSQYDEEAIEINLAGNDAGRAFAHRHIIEKMNLFIDEYRRNGYTEDFIKGFVDGINDVTGGVIYLDRGEESDRETEETVEEELEHEHS